MTTPMPSPLPYPLARESNVKHFPSGLRKFSAVIGMIVFGVRIIPAPAAIAWWVVSIDRKTGQENTVTHER